MNLAPYRLVLFLTVMNIEWTIIRKLPYKEFVIFNLKLKDHQLQVNSFIKSNFP